jgi:nucleotide-binding universal stress UspA family protein
MFEKIVVGVDGHDGGRDALALATVLGSLWNAEVATARCSTAGALHRTAVAEDADLIVVGSAGQGPPRGVPAGDLPAATLRGAPCAVAVTPRDWRSAPATPDAIAVGVAEERETEAALQCGIALAHRAGGSLTLLCVVALPRDLEVDGAFVGEVGERYRAGNDALARRVSEEYDVAASGLTVIGRPAEELIEVSRAVDLLVVGAQRSARTGHPEIGRTTDRLVRRAGCPVIVVPPAGLRVPAPRRDTGLAVLGTRALGGAMGAVP